MTIIIIIIVLMMIHVHDSGVCVGVGVGTERFCFVYLTVTPVTTVLLVPKATPIMEAAEESSSCPLAFSSFAIIFAVFDVRSDSH